MSGVIEYAARLSKVIGPRPAGTEEEQQASFIIEETFKKFGLETWVEELNCNPNYELPRVVCCVVSIVLAVLAMFLPLLVLPGMIACVITAALFILEVVGISPLNNTAKRGISQNVIAKYVPGETVENAAAVLGADDDAIDIDGGSDEASVRGRRRSKASGGRAKGSRKRKIVIVARYDSGRVCRELKPPFFKVLGILHWCEMGGMALIPIVLLLRMLTNAEGGLLIFWDILLGVGAVLALLPVLKYIFHQTAPYSDGANNNAAGVAVMLETACRVANSADPAAIAEANRKHDATAAAISDDEGPGIVPIMHGKDAVSSSGMLPVDADLIYSEAASGRLEDASPEAEAERAHKLVEEGVVSQISVADAEAGVIGGAPAQADLANSIPLIEVPGAKNAEAASKPAGAAAPQASMPAPAFQGIPKAPTAMDAARAAEAAARAQAEAEYQQAIAARVQSFAPANNSSSSVPDWFKKGIEKANANKETAAEVQAQLPAQRSRFADALDAAAAASANSIAEFEARDANRAQAPEYSVEDRLRQMREQILGGTAQDMAEKAEKAAVAADIVASEAEAAAKAAEAAAEKTAQAAEAAELTPEEAVSKASSTLQADVAAALGARQAAEAAATAQAVGEVAEQAAVADRTISYIPVAADIPADIAVVEIGESSAADSIGKTAADILEEAQAIAGEDDSASGRKKRSIALPSLTGAMGRVSTSSQDAPLGDDAERGVGENRTALQGRRRRVGLEGLPSTDLPSKKKDEAATAESAAKNDAAKKAAAKKVPAVTKRPGRASVIADAGLVADDSTTSFLAATEEADAKAALSSLDAPVVPSVVEPVVSIDTSPSTSRFETVGNDLVADMVEDDIIIEDVDDSDYTDNVTHTGAMAGPGYVEMPKSRAQRLRSIFGRKKKEEEVSFSEAVGLDDDFDARSVGAARGDWESFRNESAEYDASRNIGVLDGGSDNDPDQEMLHTHVDKYNTSSRSLRFKNRDALSGAFDDDDDWNGGAFSTLRGKISGGGEDEDGESGSGRRSRGGRGSSGSGSRSGSKGSSSRGRGQRGGEGRQRRRSADEVSASLVDEDMETRVLAAEDMIDERERIRSFRTGSAPLTSFEEVAAYAGAFTVDLASGLPGTGNPGIEGGVEAQEQLLGFQTEVWFVALGAELADNAGIKAFFSEHSDDMRGAVVIDLDALGAGTLSLIDEEGILKRVKASSRMKRFVTKAGAALGLHVNSVKMDWSESAAYFAAKRGLQTIHVAGIKDGKPAYQGEEDNFDDLSEEKLLENTAFVLELLNTI